MDQLKRPVLYLCILAIVTIFAAQVAFSAEMNAMDEKATSTVKAIWEAYKNKDSKAFSAAVTDDAMEVPPNGMALNKAQILDVMAGSTVTEYNLTDWKVQWLDKDAALVHYTGTVKGTGKDGKAFPENPMHCTDVLVHRGGKWLAAFHQETAMMAESH